MKGFVPENTVMVKPPPVHATAPTNDPFAKLPKKRLSLAESWPAYLAVHSNPLNRALHVIGTSLGLASVFLALALPELRLLIVAPVLAYGCAWIGHFWIERNAPATFRHPVLSLRADLRMCWLACRGRLGR